MQLRKRPTFQEIAGIINNPDVKLHYPDRTFTNLRRVPELASFYGNMDGVLDLQEQNNIY